MRASRWCTVFCTADRRTNTGIHTEGFSGSEQRSIADMMSTSRPSAIVALSSDLSDSEVSV